MLDNRGKSWTELDHAQLTRLFEAGSNIDTICKELGRTPYAVIAKLEKLGLLVSIGRYYHKVDPDPWATWQTVRFANEEFENTINAEQTE